VITKTGYGAAWLLQVSSAAALAVLLFFLGRSIRHAPSEEHRALWWVALAASAVLLLAPSWTGHAAAAAKEYRLAVIADWLHLVAGGFWVGGLFHLALTMPRALSALDRPRRVRAVNGVIRLFTRVAIPGVVLLTLAGLYNTWIHVESFRALWSTTYGEALLVKLLLVAAMIVLGAVNNFHFGPRAARLSAAGDGTDTSGLAGLERGFSRSVALEAVIGIAVLLVTSVLVFLTPARTHPTMSSAKVESKIIQARR
jgi:copper transport protein